MPIRRRPRAVGRRAGHHAAGSGASATTLSGRGVQRVSGRWRAAASARWWYFWRELLVRDEDEERREHEVVLERTPREVERQERPYQWSAREEAPPSHNGREKPHERDEREGAVPRTREKRADARETEAREPDAVRLERAEDRCAHAADEPVRCLDEDRQVHRQRDGGCDDRAPDRFTQARTLP